MANRGRPSVSEMNPVAKKVFTREFTDADGIVTVWYYDYEKYSSGLYKVEVIEDPTVSEEPVKKEKKKRKKRKPMTAAQKKAAAERLEKARAARKLKANEKN